MVMVMVRALLLAILDENLLQEDSFGLDLVFDKIMFIFSHQPLVVSK